METTAANASFEATAGDVRDPWGALAPLRRSVGVVEGDAIPSPSGKSQRGVKRFAVLRYDDCAAVLKDNITFSSRIYEGIMGPVMGHTILEMDEPEHKRFRSLAAVAFRQRALQRWESELIEPLAHEVIDAFAPRGEAELVSELTFPFPVQVIARILGLPRSDYKTFQALAFELTSVSAGYEASQRASMELAEYLTPFIRSRRRQPTDDLISALANAEVEDQSLEDEEIASYLRLLLPAGSETTYCSIGSLLFALLSHPDQLEAVKADRTLIGPAIEELLRWEPAVPFIPRLATRDTVLSGVQVPAGSHITVCLGSANRDETRFENPDAFDIHRSPRPHLAFASGPHMCLGMHLARAEMRIVLGAILDRLPDIRLEPGPPGSGTEDPHIHGLGFRKPNCLPVRFTPPASLG